MSGVIEAKIVQWGNSAGIRLTQAVLKEANLSVNDRIRILVSDREIVIQPSRRRTLREMLAMCEPNAPRSAESEAWLNMRSAGREIIT
jgi:antitoxin ChpS